MHATTILVVDDQPQVLAPIKRKLETEGFQVVTASNGAEALEVFATARPDVVSLDLMIPEVDGLTVCKRLRERSEVPILILSAKGEESDVVLGLEVGADDYLVKPFRMNELLARIRALARRPHLAAVHRPAEKENLEVGRIRLSLPTHEVIVDGVPVSLTPTEFRILAFLMRHPGRVISRDMLLEAVWGYTGYDETLINTHIKRLRTKVERNADRPEIILTVRGFGYKLAVPVAAEYQQAA